MKINPRYFLLRVLSRWRWYSCKFKGYLIFGRGVRVFGDFNVVKAENVKVGLNLQVNEGVFILGRNEIRIGDNVVLSAGSMLIDSGLDLAEFAATHDPEHIDSYVVIEDGAWIGAGAIVLSGVTIGRKAVVGAGSVVTRDVPPLSIVAGNPARKIGQVDA